MPTKKIGQKLSSYTAAATSFLAAAGTASGQIQYTDVDPDITVTTSNQPLNIDLNNDQINDFMVFLNTSSNAYGVFGLPFATDTNCQGGNPLNEMMGFTSGTYTYVKNLAPGIDISANSPDWLGTGCVQGTMGFYVVGNGFPYNEEWNDVSDGFMGLRFELNGNIHYGWARLDVNPSTKSFTLKDYAFQLTPNAGINSGDDGVTAISEEVDVIYFNRKVSVNLKNQLNEGSLSIYTTSAQMVQSYQLNNGYQEFMLNDLSAGVYLIHVMLPEGVLAKKIVVN